MHPKVLRFVRAGWGCVRTPVIDGAAMSDAKKERQPREGGDPSKPALCYTRPMKSPCVYILASEPYGTFYVGVTSDLHQRMAEHTQELIDGFTKKYGIKMLVYYEHHETMEAAIKREKLLKRWNRAWKYRLIEQMNPEWKNLFDPETGEIMFGPAEIDRLTSDPELT